MRIGVLVATLILVAGCASGGERVSAMPERGQYLGFREYARKNVPHPASVSDEQHACMMAAGYDRLSQTEQVKLDRMAKGLSPIGEAEYEAIMNKGYGDVPALAAQCGMAAVPN
jgi:hypothetical protein